ncbi:MAG: tRNA (adenosine(37)-N6)-threonylcarbamoyltransferase complex transferase subunit TsaD [Candidatus Neomarinimicrobiota bacterium]
MKVLGIETSCDETAAAVCDDGRIIINLISSQHIHRNYGGVVPEIASREHERLLNTIVNDALEQSGISVDELEGIAVTRGPGLSGTLLTGISFAKGLSQGLNIPIIGIHHLEAHIFANFLADPALKYPFVCLLVSGGHTQLWLIRKMGDYQMLGESRDDAAGEAFDKGARILGLDYPGGPEIQKLAKNGDRGAIQFPRAFANNDSLEFSFSGLKTSLLYYIDSYDPENSPISMADIAASYQESIVDVLSAKLEMAVRYTGVKTCVVAGGVAANDRLRLKIRNTLSSIKILFPEIDLCTDNAAMVAYLGELKLKDGLLSEINFGVQPNFKLG